MRSDHSHGYCSAAVERFAEGLDSFVPVPDVACMCRLHYDFGIREHLLCFVRACKSGVSKKEEINICTVSDYDNLEKVPQKVLRVTYEP